MRWLAKAALQRGLGTLHQGERLNYVFQRRVLRSLPAGDPAGPELKRRSPVPIYVDEDCHGLADVAPCAERAHGITVKLAKSGGMREAVRMASAGRAFGERFLSGAPSSEMRASQ